MEPPASRISDAFWAEFRREYPDRLAAGRLSWSSLFVFFLRAAESFGRFSFGPVNLDVRVVEARFRPEMAFGDAFAALSTALIAEMRRSGARRLDERHYLLAFMRHGDGLVKEVFGELGITAKDIEEHVRSGSERPQPDEDLEPLLTPEEAATYLKVHVETVRQWIRSGHLPASRIAGLRALRVRASDVRGLLQPVDRTNAEG